MYLQKIFILLLVIPLLSAHPAHKFYVSITNIEYVKKQQSLQIITKIFTDDIEQALRQRYTAAITLDSEKETEAFEEDIKKYLLNKISLKVNGKPAKLNYIGREYETDMLVAYIEVMHIPYLESIEIQNTVLTELFPDQKNIVHLKTPTARRSLILEKDVPYGKLKFN